MKLKNLMLLFTCLSSTYILAQPDKLHYLSEEYKYVVRSKSQQMLGPDDTQLRGFGYERYDLNSANGSVTGANTYTKITDHFDAKVDQAIGINSANYLYYVSRNPDVEFYDVYSANTTGGYQAGTNRLVASRVAPYTDLDGVRNGNYGPGGGGAPGMGVDQQDLAWLVTNTPVLNDDGYVDHYIINSYSFQTNASGDLSGFATHGKIIGPSGIPYAAVQDLCFDVNNNMYLLVADGNPYDGFGSSRDSVMNARYPQITYYICRLTAAQVADLAAGSNVTLQNLGQIKEADGTVPHMRPRGLHYTISGGLVDGMTLMGGLAMSAAGRLLVNVNQSDSVGNELVHSHYVWQLAPGGGNYVVDAESLMLHYAGGQHQGGSYVSDLATNIFDVALPVRFGAISGRLRGNRISLDWVSESETNNAYYEVQLSKNGTDFVTVGDKMYSKAADGNTDTALTYNFTYTLAGATGLAGLYGAAGLLLLLLVVPLFLKPGKKRVHTALLAIITALLVVTGISCQKSAKEEVETAADGKFYARIMQVDKDGKKETSKIIVVRRQD